MKKLFLLIIWILYLPVSYSQTYIDSLLSVKNNIESADVFDAEHDFEVFLQIQSHYVEIGDYHAALSLIDTTMHVFVTKYPYQNSIYTRELMRNLTSVQYCLNNFTLAIEYGNRAVMMYEVANDSCSISYMELLSNLSDCYRVKGDTVSAKMYIEKSFKQYKNTFGDKMWDLDNIKQLWLQTLVNNYGLHYFYEGNYEMAKKCYYLVIQSLEDYPSHELFQTTCCNLALLLMNQGRFKESATIINKCLPYCRDNYLNFGFYQILITDYVQLRDTSNATDNLMRFNCNALNNIGYHFTNFAEFERDDYWSIVANNTLSFNNWATYLIYTPEITRVAFEMNVYYRYFILNYTKWVRNYFIHSDNSELKDLYQKYISDKQKYVFGQKNNDLYFTTNSIEEYLINNADSLLECIMLKYLFFNDIRDFLSDGEFIVQFCDVGKVFINTDNPIQSYYTVFLLGKNYRSPLYYFLCPKYEIDMIMNNNENLEEFYSNLYSNSMSNKLYKLIFEPLEHFFKNVRTIYYAPSGDLVNINFDLLTDSTGIPLCQKYKMVRVSSTANIPEVKSLDLKSAKTASLYGGIDYKNTSENAVALSRGVDFRNLPNTHPEIIKIFKILTASNIKTDTLCGENATEESLKKLSGNSPDILHIATHGFYLDEDSQKPFAQNVNSYSQKESAMVLAGLALSGADKAWKGNFENVNFEDGILTAYEISQLDLSNTKLVVLSACETARGKIFPVDGVFGLQRAFKQAGAGAILMSLWKVDDGVTAIFMEHFYKFLFETNDRHKALKLAQDEVKKQFPDPFYWAAWVMLD